MKTRSGLFRSRREDAPLLQPPDSVFASFVNVALVLMSVAAILVAVQESQLFALQVHSGCRCIGPHGSEPVRLQASSDDTFFWNREGPYPLPYVRHKLGELCRAEPRAEIWIASDTGARFGDAARLLDEVNRAGIHAVRVDSRLTPGRR